MFKINYEGVKTEYDVILTEQAKENARQNGYTEEELRKLLASARDEYHSKVKSNLPLMMPAVSAYQIVYMRQNVIEMQGKNGQNPVRLKRERP